MFASGISEAPNRSGFQGSGDQASVVMKFSQMVYTRWGTQDSEVGLHLQQLMVYGTYNSTYWGL